MSLKPDIKTNAPRAKITGAVLSMRN